MKPRSLLFTIYGEYVRHYGDDIWVGSLTKLMGQFGMTEQAVRAAISRMLRQGWLEARRLGNRSYYSLTQKGRRHLDEAAERIYREEMGRWNGKWCIINYSIPEEQRELRDELRKEITYLGFGMLSNSTWISPNPLQERIKELVDHYGIKNYVDLFTAEYIGSPEPKELVHKCWNIAQINEAYKEFLDQFRPRYEHFKAGIESGALKESECFVEKTLLVHEYRKFLFIDPDLPDELLPDVWLGKEADRFFNQYYHLLHPGAVAYFEEVYEAMPQA